MLTKSSKTHLSSLPVELMFCILTELYNEVIILFSLQELKWFPKQIGEDGAKEGRNIWETSLVVLNDIKEKQHDSEEKDEIAVDKTSKKHNARSILVALVTLFVTKKTFKLQHVYFVYWNQMSVTAT